MKVIDGNGFVIGTVKDIGFTIGKQGINLTMDDDKGQTREIAWDQVQAAGDYILLKPQPESSATQTATSTGQTAQICPSCKGPLTWIPQYQRWYCYREQKYV